MRYSYGYGVFCIDAIPNQPQVAHCHSFFVPVSLRGKGYGHLLKNKQNAVLVELGFDYATCTTAADNYGQHKVLTKAGWHILSQFDNSNTGKGTLLWGYHVSK